MLTLLTLSYGANHIHNSKFYLSFYARRVVYTLVNNNIDFINRKTVHSSEVHAFFLKEDTT